MTKEEAIAIIRKEYLCVDRDCDIERSCGRCDLMIPTKEPILEAYNMAIKALEQEPCENAISRKAAIDTIESWLSCDDYNDAERHIMRATQSMLYDLPSVNPQESKTGHWIETAEEYYKVVNEYGGGVNEDTPYFVDDIACSVCLAKYSVINNETERFDCCPSCGAKMVESQESEADNG